MNKPYKVVDNTEATDKNGKIKDGYEERAYCYVKLIPVVVPVEEQKRRAYQTEADKIGLEYLILEKKGHPDAELRLQEWVAKCAEIQGRFE